MLKLAEKKDEKRINTFCSRFPLGVRISCQMSAYGFERDFVKIWFGEIDNNISAVICSFDSSLTICAEKNADFIEIKAFADSIGYSAVCAEKSVFEFCGFDLSYCRNMYIYRGCECECSEVQSFGEMKKVYNLISDSIPNSFSKEDDAYFHFLSDFTFRQRRNLARLKTICKNENVLSCALTAVESETSALISGVACDASQRGKGYGKKTVLSLANELKSEGKQVYVIALNQSAESFYEKIGFEKCIEACYFDK